MKRVVHTPDDPTAGTYRELQAAWKHFNRQLFGNELPPCLVTLHRKANTRGYFSPRRFGHRDGRQVTDELALNPKHIHERSPAEVLSTLVHEMTHLWQHNFGNPVGAVITTANGPT